MCVYICIVAYVYIINIFGRIIDYSCKKHEAPQLSPPLILLSSSSLVSSSLSLLSSSWSEEKS